jgi:ABC-type multidrug transport system fused ATPase/permease subunit
VLGYARPYSGPIAWFLGLVVIESVLVVATPLLLKSLIDDGIYPRDSAVVVRLSLIVAGIAVVSGALTLVERWFSARIGEGLIYDLRTQVFGTCCASRSPSSPGPRPGPWSAGSTTTSSVPSRPSRRCCPAW